jgi:hypothetical protein
VLWPELIHTWELQPDEVEYINVQQGTRCERCGGNVRSQALARGLLLVVGWPGTLESYVSGTAGANQRILEINEAGTLSPWLARLAGHRLVRYPEVDMARLPFHDRAFDVVVHSDTARARPRADGSPCRMRARRCPARRLCLHGSSACRQADAQPPRAARELPREPGLAV